ncbi:metal ABC transporter ATP-binding protein [Streptococcus halichoeri]|uniref:metal ABC transporter ATP-binding protein n=1 Tax=Streptococcus halichoeri TaxID=254785 RepID=UPI0013573954|nr:metal ABC transporter ATP-binding protein [Streptococcus halichoeri]
MLESINLTVSYDGREAALNDVSFTIDQPGIIGIIGPNGAGKSTLMKALLNLLVYTGEVKIDGELRTKPQSDLAYVEQRSQIDLNFPITVKECVALGTFARLGLMRPLGHKMDKEVAYYLKQVGLENYAERPIKSLSGGQFQRMLLARCLIQQTNYLFLDEPFVGIDSLSETIIMDCLRQLKSEGKTIVIVHHDLSKVEAYFDQLIVLNKRLIAQGTVADVFTRDVLNKAYGNDLIVQKRGR